MTQRTVQRSVAVTVLSAILLLATAPAQARDLGPAPRALLWLQDLWSKGIPVLWEWTRPAALAPYTPGDLRKEGHGTDPMGSPSPTPPEGTSGAGTSTTDPAG